MITPEPIRPPAVNAWLLALADDLQKRKRDHLWRQLPIVQSTQGPTIKIDGHEYLQFCTNNYLGLADHPEVIDSARQAVSHWGFGTGASRLIAGSMQSHHELESELAGFKKTQAALVFTSGYAANMAVLGTFAGAGDWILSDKLNHASLLDAARFSQARCHTFGHLNYQRAQSLLERIKTRSASSTHDDHIEFNDDQVSDALEESQDAATGNQRRRFLVTDTVFSMDGDLADLPQLTRLGRAHDALVVIDEAHATGVLGPDGRGVAALQNVESDIAVGIGTLSKALGSVGGFVFGDRTIIDSLINKARHFIYTTALPAACSSAALTALRIARREPQLRQRVMTLAQKVRSELKAMGYSCGLSESPIIPVILGGSHSALTAAARLKEQGIYVPAIRPPTVPPNTARIRISLMATHTDEHIGRLLHALKQMRGDPSIMHEPSFTGGGTNR
ncbi:MAG TPA: 8-amino-7-oxononanoate synthase [Phycisphaerae bacterium]|nr:8-amino-7-oxononanoate synthase [Phycisphaerae bacterium]